MDYFSESNLLFVISGPTGIGKTTLCKRMVEMLKPYIDRVITSTTRSPRDGEMDGVDYHFLTKQDFEGKVKAGAFYEYAEVYGNCYGTLKTEVDFRLKQKKDLLLNIDVQGAEALRTEGERLESKLNENVITVFVMPEHLDVLRERLHDRGVDNTEAIEQRLKIAEGEMAQWMDFDYCIPSRSKEEDFACFLSIYGAEKLKVRVD